MVRIVRRAQRNHGKYQSHRHSILHGLTRIATESRLLGELLWILRLRLREEATDLDFFAVTFFDFHDFSRPNNCDRELWPCERC